jgi:hypothetical protein
MFFNGTKHCIKDKKSSNHFQAEIMGINPNFSATALQMEDFLPEPFNYRNTKKS